MLAAVICWEKMPKVPAFVLPVRVRLASTSSSRFPETPLMTAQTIVDVMPSEIMAVADCILISAFIATVKIKQSLLKRAKGSDYQTKM